MRRADRSGGLKEEKEEVVVGRVERRRRGKRRTSDKWEEKNLPKGRESGGRGNN